MTARNWCFTSYVDELKINKKKVRFAIYQREICPTTGRPHWQGYAEFFDPCRMTGCQKAIGDKVAHIEPREGTREEAINYCRKIETRIEGTEPIIYGDMNITKGHRSDLDAIYEDIKNGKSLTEISEDYPSQFIKYHSGITRAKNLFDEKQNKTVFDELKTGKLNEYQTQIINYLNTQNDRQILWVCDTIGGKGKTWLSKYLIATGGAFRCCNGKNADIALAYNGEPIFIMDLSRSMEEHVNYDIIEQIKNGMLFSPKYQSNMKIFKIPKVLILANFMPDQTKLSQDRWQIYSI